MAKKSKEYWNKRFEALELAQIEKGAAYFAELEKQYTQAARQVQSDINKWYARFANNNEITLQEARKLLTANELEEFKWDVMQYVEKGRDNAVSKQWMKQLENASAKWHISRLEALKVQMQNHVEVLYGNEQDDIADLMSDIYTGGYYHTAYEIQKGFNIGYDLMKLDTDKVEKLISKPWAADGSNFSDRIWKQKSQLVSELHNNMTQAIVTGKNPAKVTDEIAKRFDVSKGQAGRLVMTETAFFASASTKDAFNELDVEQYEILATLDTKTSDTCRELDGKVFKMSEYEVGVTAPPFHVWCRTTTVPYFDDEFELGTERAARDEDTGETYYVPSDMKYPEWKDKFVDGGSKEDLEFVQQELDLDQEDRVRLDAQKINSEEAQEYRPINRSSVVTETARGGKTIRLRQIENSTYKGGIHISDAVELKPKQMHNIEKSINDALNIVGNSGNLPNCVIISSAEMQTGAICTYNATANVIYIDSIIGDVDKLLELQKDMACSDNPLSTYVHELIHWKDAESYRKTSKITSQKDYIESIREKSKKKLDNMEKQGYNIFNISPYATDKYLVGAYDETLTEYKVLQLLGKGD